jgi:hypothetical protein
LQDQWVHLLKLEVQQRQLEAEVVVHAGLFPLQLLVLVVQAEAEVVVRQLAQEHQSRLLVKVFQVVMQLPMETLVTAEAVVVLRRLE